MSQPQYGSQEMGGWEEQSGIMDSIVGIIPRNTPQRGQSFTGLLYSNDVGEVDGYTATGPPTPYDNHDGSPEDAVSTNATQFVPLPTFSFLNVPIENNKRNINVSKLYELNPLLSKPPARAQSTLQTSEQLAPEEEEESVAPATEEEQEINTTTTTLTTLTTLTTNNYENYDNNNNNNNNNNINHNNDNTINDTNSQHSNNDEEAATPSTPPEKRKRGGYNTRNRAHAQEVDEVVIQPRSKRTRRGAAAAQDSETPNSEPDPVSTPPPPARRARGANTGATTQTRRGRGARGSVVSPDLHPANMPIYSTPSTPIIPTHTSTGVVTRGGQQQQQAPAASQPSPSMIASQIKGIETKYEAYEQQVHDLHTQQISVISQNKRNAATEVVKTHEKLSGAVSSAYDEVDMLMRTVLLEPIDITRTRAARENIDALSVRLRIMRREIDQFVTGNCNEDLDLIAALIIREQPPPKVIFKTKIPKDMGKVVVELVKPLRCDATSSVLVNLGTTSTEKKEVANIKAIKDPLLNFKQDLDHNATATFDQLKLNASTRMITTNLTFTVTTKTTLPNGKVLTQEITSPHSSPFIAITNESQWPEAAGKLLYHDAFDNDRLETSWCYYANALQLHFMTITNQNMENPSRKLQPWELHYIHSRFGFRAMLSKDATDRFWNFFGAVMLNIHFKRKILEMWTAGLIYGLISKEECSAVLSKQKEGTFLIRFSESIPGAFAIAHVTDSGNSSERVRHCLVKSEDLGANKALPDYLRERNIFLRILKVNPPTKVIEVVDKDTALESFYKERTLTPTQAPGYVLLN